MRTVTMMIVALVAGGGASDVALAQSTLVQPGTVVSREASADAPEDHVMLAAGQALRATVKQQGADLSVTVLDPKGQLIVEVNSRTMPSAEESVWLVAQETGEYRLRVRPVAAATGRYELRVEPPTAATADDRRHADLQQTVFISRRLLASGDSTQVAGAVARIRQAVAAARAAGDKEASRALLAPLRDENQPAALDILDLSSVAGPVPVYYSRGYEARARTLQAQATRAVDYFSAQLEVRPAIVLAVLAQRDWEWLADIGYGMPWAQGERSWMLAIPATHAMFDELAAQIRQQPESAADIARAVQATGLSYEEGMHLAADAIMYHELGHIFSGAYGTGQPNLWLGEFLAGYFLEVYQAEVTPDARVAPFARLFRNWLDRSSKPTFTALEDLESRYVDMAPANYGWYQAQFEDRAQAVFRKEGLTFIRRLKTALPASEKGTLPVAEVLARLERISPGFVAWGASLASRSK